MGKPTKGAIYKRWALAFSTLAALANGCAESGSGAPTIPWERVVRETPPQTRVVLIGDSLGAVPTGWKALKPTRLQVPLSQPAFDLAIVTHPVDRQAEPHLFWESLRRGLTDSAAVWVFLPLPPDSLAAPFAWQRPIAAAGWRGHTLDTLGPYLWLRATH